VTKQKRTTEFTLYRSAGEGSGKWVRRPKHRVIHLLCTVILAAGFCLHRDTPALATPSLQTIAVVDGQPDDITVDNQGRLVWGDLATNTVNRLEGGRVVTVARGISVPEGIVVLPNGSLIVAEQGRDRILRLNSRGGSTVLYILSPVAGQEGVDGIGRDPTNGDLLIPDSPHGAILRMDETGGYARLVVHGLGRPVAAAVDAHGNILAPDEHLGTLVVVGRRGRVSYRGSLSTPDDVSVARSGRVWVTTLGDNALWALDPGAAPRRVLSGLANPQGLTLDRCGDPIVVEQNAGRIVRLLLNAKSSPCAL
jgi:sugar lactone lactonase YvrE